MSMGEYGWVDNEEKERKVDDSGTRDNQQS